MSIGTTVKLIATGLIDDAKRNNNNLTLDLIRECVERSMSLIEGSHAAVDAEKLICEFDRDYHTVVDSALSLESDEDNWEPWLNKSKADIEWKYWQRYRLYLLKQKNLPKPVIDSIDDVTDKVLGNLVSPMFSGSWDRRGMVVGNVQAGKTTNYSGLICKAADAGYKVIIVLTGFHNNLRTQTQIRLEEAFVGYDITASSGGGARQAIGVGHDSDSSLRVDTITNRSETGDFRRTVAEHFGMSPGGRPLLFVIKKNASVLKNLINYLESVSNDSDSKGNSFIKDIPLLLIDDEADQGSVDTKKMDVDIEGTPDPEHEPARLNGLIRKILFIFKQSAYVGYTATPFANIFIHNEATVESLGDDLFPRSFIVVMPTPSNYIGPDSIFGRMDEDEETRKPGLPILRPIQDYAETDSLNERDGWMPPKHNKEHVPLYNGHDMAPPSLREAVIAFIISCAVRIIRGQGRQHNSMLIHVTRFTDVQERVYAQVANLQRDIHQILLYGEEGSKQELLFEMQQLWDRDFAPTNREVSDEQCPKHSWTVVSEKILSSAGSITVRRINGSAGDVLDYEKHNKTGLNVIAIGGDKLSRGLTLEGLLVSYFTRPTRMYDTLMQMGRWFGYKDKFIDVCRLYAPGSLFEWFEHITDASEQLKNEFLLMSEMGETPATYGQRVQTHPVLMVTSQVKMRYTTELTCSYQGAISETVVFSRTTKVVNQNFNAGNSLISKIDSYASRRQAPLHKPENNIMPGKYMWSGVDMKDILEFLKNYQTPNHARKVNNDLLAKYIEGQINKGDLKNWSVLLAGKDPEKSKESNIFANYNTGLLTRKNLSSNPDKNSLIYRIKRIVSPSDENWDLNMEQFQSAIRLTADDRRTKPGGEEIRVNRDRSNALLILYPLENQEHSHPTEPTNSCYLGFAISFPGNRDDTPIKYRVNQVYQEQVND